MRNFSFKRISVPEVDEKGMSIFEVIQGERLWISDIYESGLDHVKQFCETNGYSLYDIDNELLVVEGV